MPAFGETQPFFIPQFPEALLRLDPDNALRYLLTLMEQERGEEELLLEGLLDLFDPDKCPDRYLPYLAEQFGLRLRATDPIISKRQQIKNAIRWYKEKGKPSAFEILFRSLGYEAIISELWTDGVICKTTMELFGTEDYFCADIPPGWYPHSRIDITFQEASPNAVPFDNYRTFVLQRIEEVRPAHVLLRKLGLGKVFTDDYPEVTDECELDLNSHHSDTFALRGGSPCFPTHFYHERPRVQRDGKTLPHRFKWQDRLDGNPPLPYEDPFTWQNQIRAEIKEDTGGLVYRNNGYVVHRDGRINHDGGSDSQGRPYLHDFYVHDAIYFRNCKTGWDSDTLLVGIMLHLVDQYGTTYFHDGYVTKRDGTIPSRDYHLIPLDTLAIGINYPPVEDTFPEPIDSMSIQTDFNSIDRIKKCGYYHDGELLTRGITAYYHDYISGLNSHDGEFDHDGEIDHDAPGIIIRDGTIDRRGYAGDLPLRNNANPFYGCVGAEEGDILLTTFAGIMEKSDGFGLPNDLLTVQKGGEILMTEDDYVYPNPVINRWDDGKWDDGRTWDVQEGTDLLDRLAIEIWENGQYHDTLYL